MTSPRLPLTLAATVVALLGVSASPNPLRSSAQAPSAVKLASPDASSQTTAAGPPPPLHRRTRTEVQAAYSRP